MNIKNKIHFLPAALVALFAASSCSYDLEPGGGPESLKTPGDISILRAYVDISDWGPEEESKPATRLSINEYDDWSYGYSSFGKGDTVGIFTRTGNMNLLTSDGKGGPLINVPMYFVEQEYPLDPNNPNSPTDTKYTLENDTVLMSTSSMNNLGVMMYYPYETSMGNIDNYPFWRDYATNVSKGNMMWGNPYPALPGLEVRTLAPDGQIRCRDILFMYQADADYLTKGILRGTFRHLFNEIVVIRGEGFKNPVQKIEQPDGTTTLVPNEEIVVVLDKPISHLRPVSRADNVYWTFQLYYQDGYTFNGESIDEEEAKRWYAWKGNDFLDPNNKDEDAMPAYYVMFPNILWATSFTAASGGNHQNTARPVVSEIQIYDDFGYLQHITNYDLQSSADPPTGTPTKTPYPYYRYAIQVDMTELGPTVKPVRIDNWETEGDDKDLTELRTAGIDNEQDYIDWARFYNDYIASGRSAEYAEPLKAYGDMIDDGALWNFYIAPFSFTQTVPVVTDLQDRIIGNNNFFNIVFDNLQLTHPLFSKISRNGGIVNIDFRSPYLSVTSADPVGILASSIDMAPDADPGVAFLNCNISNGTVINNGSGGVGILAGSCSYGLLDSCKFSGFLMGSSSASGTFKGLFGVTPENEPEFSDTNFNDIIIGTN